MGTRIQYDVPPELVKPKLDDLNIETVNFPDATTGLPLAPRDMSTETQRTDGTSAGNYKWVNWGFNFSLSQVDKLMEGAEKFFKGYQKVVNIVVAVLKLIRVFSSDLKDVSKVFKVLIKLVVKLLRNFIDGFTSTGLHVSFIGMDGFDSRDNKFQFPINGGFQEFLAKVNASCLNSTDADAPRYTSGDKVGGAVIGMIGGTNDPKLLEDMVDNFEKLAMLFAFGFPQPTPPRNLKAVPGIYRDRKENKKRLGIKVSWQHPSTPLTRFYVFRSPYPNGSAKTAELNGEFVEFRVFEDPKKAPVEVHAIADRPRYSIIDFDVDADKTYYYKVFSVLGSRWIGKEEWYHRTNAPNASQVVSALPKLCIPMSELDKYITLDLGGSLVSPLEFSGDWQSLSVRRMVNPVLDKVFAALDTLADKMSGIVTTGTDAFTDYLKVYQKKIEKYLAIINKIKVVIERLLSFSLRGNFLVLNLPPEKGGMEGFVKRFNEASSQGDRDQSQDPAIPGASKNVQQALQVSSGQGIAGLQDKGIMFGLLLVYGFPDPDSDYFKENVPQSEIDSVTKSMKDSQKALETLMDLLGLGG